LQAPLKYSRPFKAIKHKDYGVGTHDLGATTTDPCIRKREIGLVVQTMFRVDYKLEFAQYNDRTIQQLAGYLPELKFSPTPTGVFHVPAGLIGTEK
jgi:hypothetical protein